MLAVLARTTKYLLIFFSGIPSASHRPVDRIQILESGSGQGLNRGQASARNRSRDQGRSEL